MNLDSRLEELLVAQAFEPPPDFVERVMRDVALHPKPRMRAEPPAWLSWVAAIAAVAFGIGQLVTFMFTAWITAGVE